MEAQNSISVRSSQTADFTDTHFYPQKEEEHQ